MSLYTREHYTPEHYNPELYTPKHLSSARSYSVTSTMASNQAAWLVKADAPLEVGEAPMPTAGPGEIVIRNAAIAINPVDTHMQKVGIFVTQWPSIIGLDVAGEVHEVGPDAGSFKKGDRIIG